MNSLLNRATRSYPLIDRDEPELLRDQFPYTRVPRIFFDGIQVPMNPPEEIWITDTTFRDGQQARPPFTPAQIEDLFTFLHKLGGPRGLIRQSEFFLYSDRDKEAVRRCQDKGYTYPEVTGWIRADAGDLRIVQDLKLKETGILLSVSDYHIYLKMKKRRSKIMDQYLGIVKDALALGIVPRCHFEDVTRADIHGFCLPLAQELLKLSQESGIGVKIRLCDTMGFGVSFPGAVLPRSVDKLIHAFNTELGYPSALLEWHGHNDFHKVHTNAATAWLYGCASLNATLLGFGERTGNPPLEGAVIEYLALTGDYEGIDTTVITDIARYFTEVLKAPVPANYPFTGSDFNTTRAGIHADGIMKNEEIYNIFDTTALLRRPIKVTVTDKSGMAGIAQWLNENLPAIVSGDREPVSKRHPGIKHIAEWVANQYEHGRTTGISPEELFAQARHYLPSYFVSRFEIITDHAVRIARKIARSVCESPVVKTMGKEGIEQFLKKLVSREGSIQLIAVTDTQGKRVGQVYTQRGDKGLFRNLMTKNFKEKEWFIRAVTTGEPYYSDLFFSKYTQRLIMTAALPLRDLNGSVQGVIDIDFMFDELAKIDTDIPDEILD
ncbi:MAG: histone-lysine N-methyltransferase [Spirochaetales bacterium]|nr:histone-lysine N-methyltransferase [Spirochaetales bacterium]